MIKLKPGVIIRIGGREYKDSVPEEICPENLKPSKRKGKADESA